MKKIIINISLALVLSITLCSCYEKIPPIEILSAKEYTIEENMDTTIYIKTNSYNYLFGIRLDSEFVDISGLQEDVYIFNDEQKTRLNVDRIGKSLFLDYFEVDNIVYPFFEVYIEYQKQIQYKVQIKNDFYVKAKKIELVLANEIHTSDITFKLN